MHRGIATSLLLCLAVALGLIAPAANAAIGSFQGAISPSSPPIIYGYGGPWEVAPDAETGGFYTSSDGLFDRYDSAGNQLSDQFQGIPPNDRNCQVPYQGDLPYFEVRPGQMLVNPVSDQVIIQTYPSYGSQCRSQLAVYDRQGNYLGVKPPVGAPPAFVLTSFAVNSSTGGLYQLWSTWSDDALTSEVVLTDAAGTVQSSFVLDPAVRYPLNAEYTVEGQIGAMSVDPQSGDVFVAGQRRSNNQWEINRYTQDGSTLSHTYQLPSNLRFISNVSYDQSHQILYAMALTASDQSVVVAWNNAGTLLGTLNGSSSKYFRYVQVGTNWPVKPSLGVNSSTGYFYVTDPSSGTVSWFAPDVVPEADSGTASSVTPNVEAINASVNPSGLPLTSCVIEYGTTTSYGSSVPCDQSLVSIGSGNSNVAITATIPGLNSGAGYNYRVKATNANGFQAGFNNSFTTSSPNTPEIIEPLSADASGSPVTLTASINPHYGSTSYYFVYGPTSSYGQQTATSLVPVTDDNVQEVSAQISGSLTPGATYHFAAVASNSAGSTSTNDFTFVAPANAPLVSGVSTAFVHQTTASFSASINAGGSSTSCQVEVVADSIYQTVPHPYTQGISVPCSPDTVTGSSPVSVSALVLNLQPNTLYRYHLRAQNWIGADDSGDLTFTTAPLPPDVSGLTATNIGSTSATLHAQLVRNSDPVTYYFQYGVNSTFGLRSPLTAAAGDGPVSFEVTGLAPNTVYHFNLVANSSDGYPTYSQEATFKTSADTPPVILPPAPPALVAPEVFFYSGPRPESAEQQAAFTFSGSSSVTRYECQIDDGSWLPCTSGFNSVVVPGDHVFHLRGLTAAGASSQVFTYYWTVNIPQQCVVKTARARLLLNTSNRQAGLTTKYKTYSPAKNVVSIFYARMKGGKKVLLGQSTTNFKTAGTVKVFKPIDKATWKKVKKAKSFAMQLKVPHVQAICNQYLTKALTIKRVFSGNPVWFQWDALFSPKPLTR